MDRNLTWDGVWNARDLGGLPTHDGGRTRPGRVVRSEHLVRLSPGGWHELRAYGIRTLVDLRNTDEARRDRQHPPTGVDVVSVPVEDGLDADPGFAQWASSGLDGTPLYYGPFLERWAGRFVRAVTAVAYAPPGGVLIHCARGADRTGLLTALVLRLCAVPDELIADDYALTVERMRLPAGRAASPPEEAAERRQVLRREGFSDGREAMLATLRDVDLVAHLRRGGLSDADRDALRARVLAV